jgi:hypothetical protein
MAVFQLRLRDDKERLVGTKTVECRSDQQAIDIAAQMKGSHTSIEVWHDNRSVCRIGRPDQGYAVSSLLLAKFRTILRLIFALTWLHR